jgi:hypothetical protein
MRSATKTQDAVATTHNLEAEAARASPGESASPTLARDDHDRKIVSRESTTVELLDDVVL